MCNPSTRRHVTSCNSRCSHHLISLFSPGFCAMSKSSKALSGLGSIKRDWSNSDVTQPAKSSQESIYWPPTPVAQPPVKKLTGSEARLKAIQDALSSMHESPPPPLAPSTLQNKRSSPDSNTATTHAPKRARQLPPDWHDALSSSTLSSSPTVSAPAPRSKDAAKLAIDATIQAHASSNKKLPSVFLSQEQTQILKLVQEGDSVFYTGSAGKQYTSSLFYASMTNIISFSSIQERENLFF